MQVWLPMETGGMGIFLQDLVVCTVSVTEPVERPAEYETLRLL